MPIKKVKNDNFSLHQLLKEQRTLYDIPFPASELNASLMQFGTLPLVLLEVTIEDIYAI